MDWWQIAGEQHGVVAHRQLLAAGSSSSTISRLARSGELRRVSRGVYRLGGAPATWHAQLWAAVLATDGIVAGPSAGRLWTVHDAPNGPVHVLVARDRTVSAPAGVVTHRVDLPAGETCTYQGLPVLTRRRTVLELLRFLDYGDGSRLADRAIQRGWLRREDCSRDLIAYPSRAGNTRLRRIAAQLSDGAAAHSERVLHKILRDAGLHGWQPNYRVDCDGRTVAVIDVAFPAHRLAIEIDGMAYHVDVERFRGDRSRQNDLAALGWTVLRFTWADLLERPDHVAARISALLQLAVS